jgi:hypothetical protein
LDEEYTPICIYPRYAFLLDSGRDDVLCSKFGFVISTLWLYCLLRSPTGVPIFDYPPDKYSSHQIMKTLLDPNIDTAKIAKQRSLETNKSATFVVDIRSLKHRDDIKKDMYGKWVHHGSHTDVFKCSFDELSDVCVEKAAQGASGDNVFYLRRLHSIHPSNKHFRRIVALISGTYNTRSAS